MVNKNKQQYLVTGAAGQLGRELVTKLKDRVIPKTRESLNLLHYSRVEEIVSMLRPDVVVHTAAMTNWLTAEQDKNGCWESNILATKNLVNICANNGLPFLFISCDSVFNGCPTHLSGGFKESSPVIPLGTLSTSKLLAEHAILQTIQQARIVGKEFKYWVIRTSTLFDRPKRKSDNFANELLNLAETRKADGIPLSDNIIRNYTYTPHLVQLLNWFLLNNKLIPSGFYHIANSGIASLVSFAHELSLALKKHIKINPIKDNIDNGYFKVPEVVTLNCDKFKSMYKRHIPTWQEGVREFAKEYVLLK